MSSIKWTGDRLIQEVRDREEEFGYISNELDSIIYVLGLKDTFRVATTTGAYIRADRDPSKAVAKVGIRLRDSENTRVRGCFRAGLLDSVLRVAGAIDAGWLLALGSIRQRSLIWRTGPLRVVVGW